MDIKQQLLSLMRNKYDFDRTYDWAQAFMSKKLSYEDIFGFVSAIRELATPLKPHIDYTRTIDISGTGGDKIKTVNVGTISSFVLTASDLIVAKQSTRGYTSQMGSRDLLLQLGIDVPRADVDPKQIEKSLEKHGLAFYYHPAFSSAFQNQATFMTELVQRGMAFVTPWHLLFWLYNPLPVHFRMYGMYTNEYLEPVARVLKELGVGKDWVVCGLDGLDEVSTVGKTAVAEFDEKGMRLFELSPADFGLIKRLPAELIVDTPEQSVREATAILGGKIDNLKAELVLANCAAALCMTGKAQTLPEGVEMGRKFLQSGKAEQKLKALLIS